jgi:tetratricopeptide (TPR) repeat protein
MSARVTGILFAATLLLSGVAAAGEPDWFTRVKEMGLDKACAVEVSRHEAGVLSDSLHVGRCYYDLGRYEEGLAVHRRLVRSPDRNYAAMARVRVGEGLFHLGRVEESRAAFAACLKEQPDAWLDGSIADRCRAWISKLDGKLVSPEREAARPSAIDEVKKEVEDLEKRLAELRKLIQRLAEED